MAMRVLVATIILSLFGAQRYVGASMCPQEREELLYETKKYILAKLGLSKEPRNPDNSSQVPEYFLTEGKSIEEVSKLMPPPKPCAVVDFVHRETTTFYPEKVNEYRPKYSMLRNASGISCNSKLLCMLIYCEAVNAECC